MDESKLRDQLDRLASEAGLPDPAGRTPIARARRRRSLNAGAAALLVVALVAAGFTGIRAITQEPRTLGGDPTPTGPPVIEALGFPGLWPETTADALAVAQAQVDDGHQPLRLDPAQTAVELATNVLRWPLEAVEPNVTDRVEDGATVELRNRTFAADVPPIVVTVERLGRTGETGIWSVTGVRSSSIEVTEYRVSAGVVRASGTLPGSLNGVTLGSRIIPEQADDATRPGAGLTIDDGFELSWPIEPGDGPRVFWLFLDRGSGAIAAAAFPLPGSPTGVGSPVPTPDLFVEGAPPDVAATAQRIFDGARAHDLGGLAALMDPDSFVYDFDDGGDPIALWREDPSVLDAIPDVLRLPFVIREVDGDGFFYIWPYLMKDGALDEVSDQERSDLRSLGFSDAEIEQMRELGGYLGPRLAIDADGVWRYYVTGGD